MTTLKLLILLVALSTISSRITSKDTYPKRTSIKGLQPDGQDTNQIIGNQVHGVAFNFVWAFWQPSKKTSWASGEVKYNGYCFKVDKSTASQVKTYSDNGVVVTGVFYGVPSWARRNCPAGAAVSDIFCAPKDANAVDYGRFVGFIANYFNGQQAHGRVADFVIHNEVNSPSWYNVGCSGTTCKKSKLDEWVTTYSKSYNKWIYEYKTISLRIIPTVKDGLKNHWLDMLIHSKVRR